MFNLSEIRAKYINYYYFKALLFSRIKLFPSVCLVLVLEFILNIFIIEHCKYTEVDWKAYMQEVEGVLNGTYDYSLLKGDTGPLVYPAGFIWIFTCLYYLTDHGINILRGQYIFAALYLINLILISRIYLRAKITPPYIFVFCCICSPRIHSIFVLRLFNDPVALILLYAAVNAFLDDKWTLGSILYSLSVSVKMNVLLFSPALLLSYTVCLGLKETIVQLIICAIVQVIVGFLFLLAHPVNYIIGAFNFGRVFVYEWTVNWKFLPEEIFVSKLFHASLLFLHVLILVLFFKPSLLYLDRYAKLRAVENNVYVNKSSQLFILPLFLSNLIGIACSRSLHYQFSVWYFHSLPFLIWSTHYRTTVRLVIFSAIELCWTVFPSTSFTSSLLHCSHLAVLYGIYRNQKNVIEHMH